MQKQDHITPIEQYVIDFVLDLRVKKKISQQGIADIIRLSRSFIADVENPNSPAKYNVRHVNALADHFGMSPKAFFPEKAMPLHFPGRELTEGGTDRKANRTIAKPKKRQAAQKKKGGKKGPKEK